MSNEWNMDMPPPKPRNYNRLILSTLIILVLVLSSVIVYQTMATPAPSRNTTVEPGWAQSCTQTIYTDGTTPVAHPGNGGTNTVGTAGQDPAAFVTTNFLSTSNQKLCFDTETFTVSSPMRITGNNIIFQGQGFGTIFKEAVGFSRGADTVSGVFENAVPATTGVQNITIRDLSIDGNKANRAFVADDGGIRFDGASNSLNRNIKIEDVYVHASAGNCINGRYVDTFIVSNFIVEHCGTSGQGGIYHGVYFLRSSNGQYISGTAKNTDDGSGLKIGVGDFNIQVTAVTSELNAKDGFEFSGGSGVDIARDVTMTGTVAANNTLNGYDLNVGAGDNRFTFSGISSIFNVQNGFLTNNLSNMTLTGCLIMNNAFGVTGWQGIRIANTKDFVITGCRIGDSQSPKSQQYGILLVSGDSFISAIGNDLGGNLVGGFIDQGSSTNILVGSNAGYNSVGKVTNFVVPGLRFSPWGSASVVVASTTYTVTGVNIFNFTSSGGTGISILIQDVGGNTLVSNAATITNVRLIVGDTISFGAFSVAPTVKAYFE